MLLLYLSPSIDKFRNSISVNPRDYRNLLYFNGKVTYSSPEFIWLNTTGPTAIKFLNSGKLGRQYQNDMFVGDYHVGNLYHFDLNKDRTKLELHPPLADTIANTTDELNEIKFAAGFGGISDLLIGLMAISMFFQFIKKKYIE